MLYSDAMYLFSNIIKEPKDSNGCFAGSIDEDLTFTVLK